MKEETKLNLALFKDSIDHILRIARILNFQNGNTDFFSYFIFLFIILFR